MEKNMKKDIKKLIIECVDNDLFDDALTLLKEEAGEEEFELGTEEESEDTLDLDVDLDDESVMEDEEESEEIEWEDAEEFFFKDVEKKDDLSDILEIDDDGV
jgi:hypothetical protein